MWRADRFEAIKRSQQDAEATTSPSPCLSTPERYDAQTLVELPQFLPFLIIPVADRLLRSAPNGGEGGGSFLQVRSGLARRAHAAHRARTGDRRLPRRPKHRRGDAEPRRAALDRPAVERACRYGRAAVGGGRRADRSPRRPPCRRRGPCRRATGLGRAARDGRAVRGTSSARRGGAGVRHPQARRRGLHARRLRRRRHHVRRSGGDPAAGCGRAPQHPGRGRHLDRQDDPHQRSCSPRSRKPPTGSC